MITAELLLHMSGGSVLTQAITVKALHNAKVINKSQIIGLASHWSAELAEYEEPEAANMKSVIDLFITLIEDEECSDPRSLPSWFRGVTPGGQTGKKTE